MVPSSEHVANFWSEGENLPGSRQAARNDKQRNKQKEGWGQGGGMSHVAAKLIGRLSASAQRIHHPTAGQGGVGLACHVRQPNCSHSRDLSNGVLMGLELCHVVHVGLPVADKAGVVSLVPTTHQS